MLPPKVKYMTKTQTYFKKHIIQSKNTDHNSFIFSGIVFLPITQYLILRSCLRLLLSSFDSFSMEWYPAHRGRFNLPRETYTDTYYLPFFRGLYRFIEKSMPLSRFLKQFRIPSRASNQTKLTLAKLNQFLAYTVVGVPWKSNYFCNTRSLKVVKLTDWCCSCEFILRLYSAYCTQGWVL